MYNMSNFGERLNELMFDLNSGKKTDGKTLAQAVGVSSTTVTRYLRGDRLPTVESLIIFADYYKCSTDFLLGGIEYYTAKEYKPCPPFCERFKLLLKEYGYTAFSFAKATNINQSLAYSWKSGKRIPALENLIKTAEFFECSIDYLLGRE